MRPQDYTLFSVLLQLLFRLFGKQKFVVKYTRSGFHLELCTFNIFAVWPPFVAAAAGCCWTVVSIEEITISWLQK